MSLVWILGVFVLAIIWWDVFITIFSLRGGGPVTEWLSRCIWRSLLFVHSKRSIHKTLTLAGPMMLLITVFYWYLGLAVGWFLIFMSQASSVVINSTQANATLLEKAYFLGTTLSDVGYGDLVPFTFPWTLLSSVAAISATLLLSAALSYILPVVSAGLQKRVLAKRIHHLGNTSEDVLTNVWQHGDSNTASYLMDTVVELQEFTHKHLSYPILAYFHSAKAEQSLGLAAVKLADALFLINHAVAAEQRPALGFAHVATNTLQDLSALAQNLSLPASGECQKAPAHLSTDVPQRCGFNTVDDKQFQIAVQQYLPLRNRLCKLSAEDGWPVDGSG